MNQIKRSTLWVSWPSSWINGSRLPRPEDKDYSKLGVLDTRNEDEWLGKEKGEGGNDVTNHPTFPSFFPFAEGMDKQCHRCKSLLIGT